jgi:hypothetical protein
MLLECQFSRMCLYISFCGLSQSLVVFNMSLFRALERFQGFLSFTRFTHYFAIQKDTPLKHLKAYKEPALYKASGQQT